MSRKLPHIIHAVAIALVVSLGVMGLCCVLFPIRPFWIDEWRLIYNLKFKSAAALWGPLDYTQQCPRMYLAVLKRYTAAAHYSYTSLRLPAFIISVGSMVLAWRLMRRIFPDKRDWLRLLFPLIIVSSQTFTDYLVQTKHYEVEIFLALFALWQTVSILRIADEGRPGRWQYALLCAGMAAAAPFSYTYPIAIAPLFVLAGIRCFRLLQVGKARYAVLIVLPLILCVCGIGLFYITDVSQLMSDEEMHRYWAYRMASGGAPEAALRLWFYFAALGAGAVFEVIFGVLGVAAFGLALSQCAAFARGAMPDAKGQMQAYGTLLVLLCVAMFFAGRLPLGEAKFNAFCVPVLAILIVALLQWLRERVKAAAAIIASILFLGLAGNIITVIITSFHAPEYPRRVAIYAHTQRAIAAAQAANAPIFITPDVAWPDEIVHKVPHLQNMTADAVLKTFPAYDAAQMLPVYSIADTVTARPLLLQLPDSVQRVMTGDGLRFAWIARERSNASE